MSVNTAYIKMKPKECLELSFKHSLDLIKSRIGETNFNNALKFEIKSPNSELNSADWLKKSKIIGINPRLVKTYWGIVKYALSFPENAIHIMPLWETGDGSLYVQNSWHLNNDFYDYNLEPLGFNTCELQLKFVINILHALGKSVGFDVMPHVDNFSEIVLLNPDCFEWVKINDNKSAIDYNIQSRQIAEDIKGLIIQKYMLCDNFFGLPDDEKEKILFPCDIDNFQRRMELRRLIRSKGYEPIPVVEHAPMRPLKFVKTQKSNNEEWSVFDVDNRDRSSIVIGAVTPYKFYNVLNGYPVKNKFDYKVVDYFINKVSEFQRKYDFDFLRADMGHNQISHSHNDLNKDMHTPEVWNLLKSNIKKEFPYFGTLAEAFLGNYYISGSQDMINKNFDIVLGDLNYRFMNSEYINLLHKYLIELKKYPFKTSLTVYTNDADIPEHDKLYSSLEANVCRYFISTFLNMPSYMGIGFEVRNFTPNSENQYSNYYVKKSENKFEFGENEEQFEEFSKIRDKFVEFKEYIDGGNIVYIDKKSDNQLVWYYDLLGNKLLCAVNLNPELNQISLDLDGLEADLLYTNSKYDEIPSQISSCDNKFVIPNIYIGECVIYRLS